MTTHDNQRQAILYSYLAGIIDGEGCIRIGLQNKDGKPYNYRPCVSVGMVEDAVVKLLHKEFGGSLLTECVPNLRPIYRWQLVKAPDVKKFLEALYDYLIIKQPQAALLLALVSNYPQSRRISEEELLRRQELYLRIKKLNAVGAAATTNRDESREG